MAARSIAATDAVDTEINLPLASAGPAHEGSASQHLSTEGAQAPRVRHGE